MSKREQTLAVNDSAGRSGGRYECRAPISLAMRLVDSGEILLLFDGQHTRYKAIYVTVSFLIKSASSIMLSYIITRSSTRSGYCASKSVGSPRCVNCYVTQSSRTARVADTVVNSMFSLLVFVGTLDCLSAEVSFVHFVVSTTFIEMTGDYLNKPSMQSLS